ncbi:MAG: aminotransferase class V-fold PLP-dependent enzyme [Acutalibacteraceae bacterium]
MDTIYLNNAVKSCRDADLTDELSINNTELLGSLKKRLCNIFNLQGKAGVAVTFNAEVAISFMLDRLLNESDNCVITQIENKSVISPLQELAGKGITYTTVKCDDEGFVSPDDIDNAISKDTRLVFISHAAYAYGSIQDIKSISEVCKRHGVILMLDASHTAGYIDVDFSNIGADVVVLSANKGLLSCNGVGVVLMSDDIAKLIPEEDIEGNDNILAISDATKTCPDDLKSGAYALDKALAFIENTGVDEIHEKIDQLMVHFLYGLKHIKNIDLVGTWNISRRMGVISIDFTGKDNSVCTELLAKEYSLIASNILFDDNSDMQSRYPQGVVRFSLGFYNTMEEIDAALTAIQAISHNDD